MLIQCCKAALYPGHLLLKYCSKALLEKQAVFLKNPTEARDAFVNDLVYILMEAVKIADIMDDKKSMSNILAFVDSFMNTTLKANQRKYSFLEFVDRMNASADTHFLTLFL